MNNPLLHPDPEERRRAAALLQGSDIQRAAPTLFSLLDDPDWRVRREVSLALSRSPEPNTVVPKLLDAVESGDVARRNAGIEALRAIGPAAIQQTLARLDSNAGGARRFLIEVLAGIGNESCIASLERFLHDPDPNLAPAATEALGAIDSPQAIEALERALAHHDPVVRLAALQAIVRRNVSLPYQRLEPLLTDPISRRVALRAAAICDDQRALNAVIDAFSTTQLAVSSEAAVACALAARRGHAEYAARVLRTRPDAVEILSRLARAQLPEVRQAAVTCLGLTGDPRALPYVLDACESPITAAFGNQALERFDASAISSGLEIASRLGSLGLAALLRWSSARTTPELSDAIVQCAWSAIASGLAIPAAWTVIGDLGTEADVVRMVAALPTLSAEPVEIQPGLRAAVRRFPNTAARTLAAVDPTTHIGLVVCETLADLGHAIPVERVRDALNDTSPTLRAAAVRALGSSRDPAARDALEFVMADEDAEVQAAAAAAIGRLGSGLDSIAQSLRAADARVRQAAARAVGASDDASCTDEQVRALLLPALRDPEPGVVLAALEALNHRIRAAELELLTRHDDTDVAAEALVHFRRIAPQEASNVARTLLEHPAWVVRLEAVRALDVTNAEVRGLLASRRNLERDEMVLEAVQLRLAAAEQSS